MHPRRSSSSRRKGEKQRMMEDDKKDADPSPSIEFSNSSGVPLNQIPHRQDSRKIVFASIILVLFQDYAPILAHLPLVTASRLGTRLFAMRQTSVHIP
jgi:hypothetical protein